MVKYSNYVNIQCKFVALMVCKAIERIFLYDITRFGIRICHKNPQGSIIGRAHNDRILLSWHSARYIEIMNIIGPELNIFCDEVDKHEMNPITFYRYIDITANSIDINISQWGFSDSRINFSNMLTFIKRVIEKVNNIEFDKSMYEPIDHDRAKSMLSLNHINKNEFLFSIESVLTYIYDAVDRIKEYSSEEQGLVLWSHIRL